jgi:DNA-binding HxlR family transcriptional regulator
MRLLKVFDEYVQHVEYRLTDLGKSLMPVIDAMGLWGEAYLDLIFFQCVSPNVTRALVTGSVSLA